MQQLHKPETQLTSPNGTPNPAMVRVTSETATQWLESGQYEHQRTVRQRHVEFLAEEMRRDKFIQGTQIRFLAFEGRRILVDGQHRLWAIIESKLPQYLSVLTTRVESKEEVAWIYGNLDIGMRRTGADLFGALELDARFQMSKTQIRLFNGAINFLSTGCIRSGGQNPLHRDDAVRYMTIYALYARQYFLLLAGCEQRIHQASVRASTLAIALLTLRFSVPAAESHGDPSVSDFWKGAIFDNGIQIGDARKIVNRHLLTVRVTNSAPDVSGADFVSTAYSARFLASCFNAYMMRRDLQKGIVRDARAPIKLYGVPADPEKWW